MVLACSAGRSGNKCSCGMMCTNNISTLRLLNDLGSLKSYCVVTREYLHSWPTRLLGLQNMDEQMLTMGKWIGVSRCSGGSLLRTPGRTSFRPEVGQSWQPMFRIQKLLQGVASSLRMFQPEEPEESEEHWPRHGMADAKQLGRFFWTELSKHCFLLESQTNYIRITATGAVAMLPQVEEWSSQTALYTDPILIFCQACLFTNIVFLLVQVIDSACTWDEFFDCCFLAQRSGSGNSKWALDPTLWAERGSRV